MKKEDGISVFPAIGERRDRRNYLYNTSLLMIIGSGGQGGRRRSGYCGNTFALPSSTTSGGHAAPVTCIRSGGPGTCPQRSSAEQPKIFNGRFGGIGPAPVSWQFSEKLGERGVASRDGIQPCHQRPSRPCGLGTTCYVASPPLLRTGSSSESLRSG